MFTAGLPGGTLSKIVTSGTRQSYPPSLVCSKSILWCKCNRIPSSCESACLNYNVSQHKLQKCGTGLTCNRRPFLRPLHSKFRSDCDTGPCDAGLSYLEEEDIVEPQVQPDLPDVTNTPSQNIIKELVWLSLPAIAGQALEPLAQLMETLKFAHALFQLGIDQGCWFCIENSAIYSREFKKMMAIHDVWT